MNLDLKKLIFSTLLRLNTQSGESYNVLRKFSICDTNFIQIINKININKIFVTCPVTCNVMVIIMIIIMIPMITSPLLLSLQREERVENCSVQEM